MSYPESIQPRVSVIVASYNNGRYVGRCLQSLGVQSLQDFEVLVIDDCSTDDSREIYTSFSANDPRFRYHELPENKGITYVRNIAFELAKGKYIAVLDADDIAYPTRLEKQLSYLETNPETVMVTCYYDVIDEQDNLLRNNHSVPITDLLLRWSLLLGNPIGSPTVMFRKDAAQQVGFYDPDIAYGEDHRIYVKLAQAGKIGCLPETLAAWRDHRHSVTKTVYSDKLIKYFSLVAERNVQDLVQIEDPDGLIPLIYQPPLLNAGSFVNFASALLLFTRIQIVFINKYQAVEVLKKKDLKKKARSMMSHMIKILANYQTQEWYPKAMSLAKHNLLLIYMVLKYRWYLDFDSITKRKYLKLMFARRVRHE